MTAPVLRLCVFLVAAGLMFTGCSDAPGPEAQAETVELRFKVDGMTCDGCVNAVHDAIVKVDGVSACEVNLEAGSAVVQARPGQPGIGETIARTVTELGYETSAN